MSSYLDKTTTEMLSLPKRELIAYLLEEARQTDPELAVLMNMSKREVMEFLITRLRGIAVNVDYDLLVTSIQASDELIAKLAVSQDIVDTMLATPSILSEIQTTIIKTVYVNFESSPIENVASIEVLAGDLTTSTIEVSTDSTTTVEVTI